MSASEALSGPQFDTAMHHAVNELTNDGNPDAPPLKFKEETLHPSKVRFQRYPETDSRVQSVLQGYRNGDAVPPVMLVRRAGETMTADGHHRLSAAEILKQPVRALVSESEHPEKYAGRARIGTLRKPR